MRVRLRNVRGMDATDPAYGQALEEAAQVLAGGGLVAFPTETVYGLGASIYQEAAIRRIFAVKGRPADNPLIVHVLDVEEARRLCAAWPPAADAAAGAFWPGPLTLVLPRSRLVSDAVSAGLETVAVRAPAHRVARDLVARAGPLAAPSANSSGRPSPTRAEHVLEDLGDRVDLVIDDGPCQVGLESTVVDLTGPRPVVLRPGGVAVESLREVLGEIEIAQAVLDAGAEAPREARSPGMKYRHYAPATRLVVVRLGPTRNVQAAILGVRREVERLRREGLKVGVLGADEVCGAVEADAAVSLGPYSDPVRAAARLFQALREVDEAKVDVVVAHTYPHFGFGIAVTNRLLRAASELRDLPDAAGADAPPRRVLFVCTGNTCRSPMAAAVLRDMAKREGLDLEVRSAGTAAFDGQPAADDAVQVLGERGAELREHRARRLRPEDVAWADLILAMTRAQRDRLRDEHPDAAGKIFTLAEYAEGTQRDVEDPVGLGREAYRFTLQQIEEYLRKAAARWRRGKGA